MWRKKIIGKFSNPCIFNARQQAKRKAKEGYRVRFGHGVYKGWSAKKTRWYDRRLGGARHMWAEYFDPSQDAWVMCKDTIRYVNGGYPVEYYGGYEVHWYGEPNNK